VVLAGEGHDSFPNMPTIKRIGRFRFFFYSVDILERPHVHVTAAEDEAKFWLTPVELVWAKGFNSREQNELIELVRQHRHEFLEKWNEYSRAS